MRTWNETLPEVGHLLYLHDHTSSRMRITDHLDHQQQGIDALPDLLSGQFSMDPAIISEVNSDTIFSPLKYRSLINDHCFSLTLSIPAVLINWTYPVSRIRYCWHCSKSLSSELCESAGLLTFSLFPHFYFPLLFLPVFLSPFPHLSCSVYWSPLLLTTLM